MNNNHVRYPYFGKETEVLATEKSDALEKAISEYDGSLNRNLAHFFLLDQYNRAYGLNTASSSKNSLSMVEMSYRANPAYGSALEKTARDYIMYGIKDLLHISFDEYCNKTQVEANILNRVCETERRVIAKEKENLDDKLGLGGVLAGNFNRAGVTKY